MLVLILILVLLLVLPNLNGCSASGASDELGSSGSSLSSLISRYVTGPSDDGLCDFCGAAAVDIDIKFPKSSQKTLKNHLTGRGFGVRMKKTVEEEE